MVPARCANQPLLSPHLCWSQLVHCWLAWALMSCPSVRAQLSVSWCWWDFYHSGPLWNKVAHMLVLNASPSSLCDDGEYKDSVSSSAVTMVTSFPLIYERSNSQKHWTLLSRTAEILICDTCAVQFKLALLHNVFSSPKLAVIFDEVFAVLKCYWKKNPLPITV